MSLAIASASMAALQAGRIVDRGLVLFDFPSGLHGFWTGLGPFTYGGVTYVGAGSLLAIDAAKQQSDLSAGEVVIRLTAIPNTALTPDILGTIEAEQYHLRPCTLMTAYFDPETYGLLSVEVEYRGYVDQIGHEEAIGGEAVLACHLDSRFLDFSRSGYRVRSDADQRRINPADDGLVHVTSVAEETVEFGRLPTLPAAPAKKKKFLGIF